MAEVNSRRESQASEGDSQLLAAAQGAQPSAENSRIPGLFRADQRAERLFASAMLAEGEELWSNPLCVRFQRLSITYHQMNCRRIADSPRYPGGAGCAACKAVFDPDLEQGGNTNIVVRRDPATGDMTRVVVHRRCRPGRSPRSASSPEPPRSRDDQQPVVDSEDLEGAHDGRHPALA
jgi:hypothetical protein